MRAEIFAAAALAAILSVRPAGAQDDASVPPSAGAPGITPPVAIGGHRVQGGYPLSALERHEEGATLVYYVVNADGSVGETRIEISSGFADLDAASIEGVKSWHFKPATKNGEPLAVSNKINFVWQINREMLETSPYYTVVHMTAADYPQTAKDAHEEGEAVIMIYEDAQGNLLNTEIQHSSGFADLDAATENLAKTRWHFTPATFDGKPVGSGIALVVIWSLRPDGDIDPAKKKY